VRPTTLATLSGSLQKTVPPGAQDLAARLRGAWDRRQFLHDDPAHTAYRLFHGHGDGCPGLNVDRLGDTVVIRHTVELAPRLDEILSALGTRGAPSLTLATLGPGRAPAVLRGEPVPHTLTVLDNGLRFQVEPLAHRSAGLYLDARPARRWLLEHSRDRRVLNLFAYTGSLGIAAAAGGARWVTHLELQKRQLRRIKANLQLNGLPVDDRNLISADLYSYLRRRRGEATVDAIVLDPPPVVPARGTHAPSGQDYETLVPLAMPWLAPGGWLLCFFHHRGKALEACEAEVLAGAGRRVQVLWRGTSGADFPEQSPDAKLRFTAFRVA
jgi:23S rRNA (cytosine1962-C5)-methyltransferase